jgi:hypothetical protein
MRLNDLLGREVVTTDGETLGRVHEALLVQDGPVLSEVGAAATTVTSAGHDGEAHADATMGAVGAAFRVHALAVSRRATGMRLGYAQGIVQAPALLRRLFGRPPTMVPWAAIVSLEENRVVVDMEQVSGQPGNTVAAP